MKTWGSVVLVLMLGGCGPDAGRPSAGTFVSTSLTDGLGGGTDDGTSSADDDTGSGTPPGTGSDTEEDPWSEGSSTTFDPFSDDSGGDTAPGVPLGCEKVDFLFVVDNSSSMDDDQANLIDNFPTFAAGIESSLAHVEDIHVGVVTTDEYDALPQGCRELGALVTQTGGTASSMSECGPFVQGQPYMTAEDDLAAGFACAARVGVDGLAREQPIEAMLAAARGEHDGPGGCNDGFIRDDALLVVVLITDETDGPNDHEAQASPGTPAEWRDELVQIKGHLHNTAIVSLVKGVDLGCPPLEGESSGGDIVTFTNLFGANGMVGGICLDHGEVLAQAVDVIEHACDSYIPPAG